MSELELLLEEGKATEATFQRLIGMFGPVAGEVIFDLVQRVLDLQASAPAPQVTQADAHASQAGA
jgi:hypothetical protein